MSDDCISHKEPRKSQKITGTLAYMSLNAHHRERWSLFVCCRLLMLTNHAGHYPRDDLESVAYVLVFVSKGSLPWDAMSEEETLSLKQRITPAQLTIGLPLELQNLLVYARGLK
jgi:hypothetical protein